MRIAAIVEYDGSAFCGWQWQDDAPSVQAAVEAALSKVANAPVRVITAGRTDSGARAAFSHTAAIRQFFVDHDRFEIVEMADLFKLK